MRAAALALTVALAGACFDDAPADAPTDGAAPPGDVPAAPVDASAAPADAPAAREEACNGLDDDLDGEADELRCPLAYRCDYDARCDCGRGRARCGAYCVASAVRHAWIGGRCTVLGTDPERPQPPEPEVRACERGALCGDACADLERDAAHCGACERACDAGMRCVAGACECPEGAATCGGRCVDTARDPANCGACGGRCPAGERCGGGVCLCAEGLHRCDGACVDLSTSREHCGSCGRSCLAGAVCAAGACGCAGAREALCGDRCIDVWTNRTNCGRCGNVCAGGVACAGGQCMPRPVAPPAGARLGSRRPTFRWRDGDGTVDVCADRACRRVLESAAGTEARGATVTRRLEPGVYFWRVRPSTTAAELEGEGWPFRVDRRDVSVPGLLPPAPDLNGDGLKDVVVAAGANPVAVFPGVRGALRTSPDPALALEADGYAASSLMAAGDLQRDGFGDVVVARASAAWLVVRGAASSDAMSVGLLGWATAGVPVSDVDADGLADWLAPASATVHYGAATGGGVALMRAGVAAAAAGDVNGDGYPDVAVGAPNASSPRAYVYFGSALGLDRSALLPPAPRASGFGEALAGAGDVNGDGFADVLARLGPAGAAVYLGGRDAVTFLRAVESPGGSLAVFAAGDVDGDGYGDLLGVPRALGEAWLYRGGAAGLAATPVVLRDARWSAVESVGAPGDVDGDGFDDVVAGSPSTATVHVFHGGATAPLTRVETLRGAAGSGFGAAVL